MSQLLTLAIASRLLAPADFGVIAMCGVVMTLGGMLRDLGTSAAIIQRSELTAILVNSVYWLNLAVAATLTLAIVLLSYPLSLFLHEPRLPPVLSVLALSLPIASLGGVHQALLERRSAFGVLARLELVSAIMGLLATVGAALSGFGVYSLVAGAIATAIVSSTQLILSSKWRPNFQVSTSELRSLTGYSGNLISFQLINFLARNVDTLLIGRVLGSGPLGIYNAGYRLMLFPLSNLSSVLTRALFPAFSRFQGQHEELRTKYLRMLSSIALITAPLMAGLWVLREPVVSVLLGDQWSEVAGILAWFAPLGFVQSLMTTVGLVYMATGQTRRMMRWGLFASGFVIIAMFIGLRGGAVGVAAAYSIANLLLFYPSFAFALKPIRLSFRNVFGATAPQAACAFLMAASLWVMFGILPASWPPLIQIAVMVPLGAMIYGGLAGLLIRPVLRQLIATFRTKAATPR